MSRTRKGGTLSEFPDGVLALPEDWVLCPGASWRILKIGQVGRLRCNAGLASAYIQNVSLFPVRLWRQMLRTLRREIIIFADESRLAL